MAVLSMCHACEICPCGPTSSYSERSNLRDLPSLSFVGTTTTAAAVDAIPFSSRNLLMHIQQHVTTHLMLPENERTDNRDNVLQLCQQLTEAERVDLLSWICHTARQHSEIPSRQVYLFIFVSRLSQHLSQRGASQDWYRSLKANFNTFIEATIPIRASCSESCIVIRLREEINKWKVYWPLDKREMIRPLDVAILRLDCHYHPSSFATTNPLTRLPECSFRLPPPPTLAQLLLLATSSTDAAATAVAATPASAPSSSFNATFRRLAHRQTDYTVHSIQQQQQCHEPPSLCSLYQMRLELPSSTFFHQHQQPAGQMLSHTSSAVDGVLSTTPTPPLSDTSSTSEEGVFISSRGRRGRKRKRQPLHEAATRHPGEPDLFSDWWRQTHGRPTAAMAASRGFLNRSDGLPWATYDGPLTVQQQLQLFDDTPSSYCRPSRSRLNELRQQNEQAADDALLNLLTQQTTRASLESACRDLALEM